MRHFPRLNRVAYGILRRRHPTVLTLLEQKTAGFRRDLGRRAPPVGYCASVPSVRCVSRNVRPTPSSVSDNVRRKWPSIARRTVHYCAPLQIAGVIKALLKAAAKAIMQRDPDALQPKTKRRRRGGTESQGPLCVTRFPQRIAARGRYATLQPLVAKATDVSVSSVPKECLFAGNAWDVFDITRFGYEHSFDDGSAAFDTRSPYLSPGL